MKKMIFLIVFLLSMQVSGQAIYTQDDVDICNSKFELAVEKNFMTLPINELMIEIGKTFLDVPYEAHTIEIGDKEELVVYLTGTRLLYFF